LLGDCASWVRDHLRDFKSLGEDSDDEVQTTSDDDEQLDDESAQSASHSVDQDQQAEEEQTVIAQETEQESAQSAIVQSEEIAEEAKQPQPIIPTQIEYELDGMFQTLNVVSGVRHRIPPTQTRASAKYMLFRFKNSSTMYWSVKVTEKTFSDWKTDNQPEDLVDVINAFKVKVLIGNEEEDIKIIMLL